MTLTELKNNMPITVATLNEVVTGSADLFLDALEIITCGAEIVIERMTPTHFELTCGNPEEEQMDSFTAPLTDLFLEVFKAHKVVSYKIRNNGMEVFVFNHFTVAIDYNPNNIFDN
jgi:hypothetical protein